MFYQHQTLFHLPILQGYCDEPKRLQHSWSPIVLHMLVVNRATELPTVIYLFRQIVHTGIIKCNNSIQSLEAINCLIPFMDDVSMYIFIKRIVSELI